MRILSLNPVQENCRVCKRPFDNIVAIVFNPIGYMPGLCQDCNHDILKNLLVKGYSIFKYDFINELDNKYKFIN